MALFGGGSVVAAAAADLLMVCVELAMSADVVVVATSGVLVRMARVRWLSVQQRSVVVVAVIVSPEAWCLERRRVGSGYIWRAASSVEGRRPA